MIILADRTDFKVNLTTEGFREKELEKLELARAHMERALSSRAFFEFCRDFSYEQKSCSGRLWWKKCTTSIVQEFRWNLEKSRKEIYNHLLCGEEKLTSGEDKEADIFLKIDRRRNRRVLGYTYPNTSWQWIYATFFGRADYREIAGNLAHEWCHKMGYQHEFKYNFLRQFTVPYAVGYFVKDFEPIPMSDIPIDKKISQKGEKRV
jgi:hypothetical protein